MNRLYSNSLGLIATIITSSLAMAKEPDNRPLLLKPTRVFDGVTTEAHKGWVVLVRGERIEAVGLAADVKVAGGCSRHRACGHDATAGADRRAHACLAAPVQRDVLE